MQSRRCGEGTGGREERGAERERGAKKERKRRREGGRESGGKESESKQEGWEEGNKKHGMRYVLCSVIGSKKKL